jgi:hypothetical protein
MSLMGQSSALLLNFIDTTVFAIRVAELKKEL